MVSLSMKASPKLQAKLRGVRNYPKESLEDVVERLLYHYDLDTTLTDQEARDVKEGLDDIINGKVYTTEQLNAKLGL